MSAQIDRERLVTWLNDHADQKIAYGTTSGLVQYSVYTGLRDAIIRGDFDQED